MYSNSLHLFISFFRGTPLLVQLVHYCITGFHKSSPIFILMDAFTAASAWAYHYIFQLIWQKVYAPQFLGIDKSQMEACLSLGMTRSASHETRIILPQASRVATPSLMNYFHRYDKKYLISISHLGVAEIMAKAQMEASSSFKFFRKLFSCCCYLLASCSIFYPHSIFLRTPTQ